MTRCQVCQRAGKSRAKRVPRPGRFGRQPEQVDPQGHRPVRLAEGGHGGAQLVGLAEDVLVAAELARQRPQRRVVQDDRQVGRHPELQAELVDRAAVLRLVEQQVGPAAQQLLLDLVDLELLDVAALAEGLEDLSGTAPGCGCSRGRCRSGRTARACPGSPTPGRAARPSGWPGRHAGEDRGHHLAGGRDAADDAGGDAGAAAGDAGAAGGAEGVAAEDALGDEAAAGDAAAAAAGDGDEELLAEPGVGADTGTGGYARPGSGSPASPPGRRRGAAAGWRRS